LTENNIIKILFPQKRSISLIHYFSSIIICQIINNIVMISFLKNINFVI